MELFPRLLQQLLFGRDVLGWVILLAWDYEAQHVFLVSQFTDPSECWYRSKGAQRCTLVRVSRVLLQPEEPRASPAYWAEE